MHTNLPMKNVFTGGYKQNRRRWKKIKNVYYCVNVYSLHFWRKRNVKTLHKMEKKL